MLFIILICKLILNNNINFNRLNNYFLGTYINKFIIKYISIWQSSSNIWIFLIIILLIIFNLISAFSLYRIITVLS
jgi:hypothetical protein